MSVQLQSTIQKLEDEIAELKTRYELDIEKLSEEIGGLYADLENMNGNVAKLEYEVADLNYKNAELKFGWRELLSEVGELRRWKKSAQRIIKNLTPTAPPRYDALPPAYSAY